jgi:transcriptional regulator with XRE-family HTH domain
MFLMTNKYELSEWLQKEMKIRNLNQSELARLAGVTRSVISKLINQNSSPAPETIESIAHALKLPPIVVFRAAGILPEEPEYVPLLDEWNAIFYELTPEDQQEILEIARMKANKRKPPIPTSSRIKRPARNALKDK